MKLFAIILTALCCLTATAQISGGINTSNWGGVTNTVWNPAIADGRYVVDISLGVLNSGAYQNHVGFTPAQMFTSATFNPLFGTGMLSNDHFLGTAPKSYFDDNKSRNINQWAILEGPGSFMVPFKQGKHAIAVTYHLNNARSIYQLDPDWAKWSSGQSGFASGAGKLRINQANWIDYGLTYSPVVVDNEKHLLKLGFTVKVISSSESIGIWGDEVSFNALGEEDMEINATRLNVMKTTKPGISAAGDIGFVYEFRPKKESLRYKMDDKENILPRYKDIHLIAFGFSVIDIGALLAPSAQSQSYSVSGIFQKSNGFNVFSSGRIADVIALNSTVTGNAPPKKIWLPTRFNAFLDYNIVKGFGLNLNSSISPLLAIKNGNQITYDSYIALTPRFDLPMFGAYMPIQYKFNGHAEVGLTLRAGPVWFGVNDFISMGSQKGIKNFNFFAGLKIPVYYKKPSDKDNDKVSSKFDLCPKEVGTWASKGCADKDGDGIRDSKDDCPELAGYAALKGCPDSDEDGVPDTKDLCPFEAGSLIMMGCPDADNDSIVDKEDLCPNEKGARSMKGCPDTDNDGVSDYEDKCKTKAGTAEHKGCPDTDGDGLYDYDDDDPEVPGPIENHGKPWDDIDDDGILDNIDKCPETPGVAEYDGCPTPPKPDLLGARIITYDALLYAPNQWELTSTNEKLLRTFASKMNMEENKGYGILIIGYTDSTETDPSGAEQLSISRAKEVRRALIYDMGISRDRIEFDGHGSEEPVGDNSKSTGRAKNRRVELKMKIVGQ